MAAILTNNEIEKLLEYVRTQECLFNIYGEKYSKRELKRKAFKQFVEEINKERSSGSEKKTPVTGISVFDFLHYVTM